MTLYRLYLKAPDVEILVAEKRSDLALVADGDERDLPLFSVKELERLLTRCTDPYEFRVVCQAKVIFKGGVVTSVTEASD